MLKGNKRFTYILLSLVSGLLCGSGCLRTGDVVTTIDGFAQGSTYHIVVKSDRERPELQQAIDSLLEEIDRSMSLFNDSSLLNRINRGETDSVDTHIAYCVETAQKISRESDGMYDITIKPIFEAWGFTGKEIDADPNIDSLLQYVGYEKIRIENGRLLRSMPGVQIDLSSIAQGYSADMLARMLETHGIIEYLVEIGGEIFCRGTNPSGTDWRVGIDKPVEGNFTPGADMQVKLHLTGLGLATSGNYRKYHTDSQGRKIVHTINPKTGYSEISNLLSATVIAENATLADAYGTLMMVVGLERSIELLNRHPELMGYLVYTDDEGHFATYVSPALEEHIIKE